MQLPRFMRTKSGLPVEVLAQNVSNLHPNPQCSVIVLVHTENGSNRVGYRLADGSHPHRTDQDYDLIPYKADEAARHVQLHVDPTHFSTARHMWKLGKKDVATEIVAHGSTDIDLIDFGYYLNTLWG